MKKKSLLKTALLIVYMAGQSALCQSIGTLYNTDATGMNSIIRQIPGYPGRYITATSHSFPSSALENHFIYTDNQFPKNRSKSREKRTDALDMEQPVFSIH